MIADPVKFLHDLSDVAIAAANPLQVLPNFLPEKPKGRIIVIGAGKASAAMARAVENTWGDEKLTGVVVTRYGYNMACDQIEIVEAAHPVPDKAGENACQKILRLLDDVTEDDLVLFLISGGGSALLSYPAPCLTSQEKRDINAALLRSGANIHEMNTLRKHISLVKGGQLALAAHPAKICTLIISDVPGDDPATVASGPTLPDPTTQKQALEVIEKYNINVSDNVRVYLANPKNETPKSNDPRFEDASIHIISSAQNSLDAAAKFANKYDLNIIDMGDDLEGETSILAQNHIKFAMQQKAPTLLISGGETTVTLADSTGRGGRNTEYILAAAIAASGHQNIYAIAVDTDGIDGSEDNAGAYFTPQTLKSGCDLNLEGKKYLQSHDSYSFFEQIGNLVKTGPTFTNVNDFRAILVLPH